jgi:hypothetical protein
MQIGCWLVYKILEPMLYLDWWWLL